MNIGDCNEYAPAVFVPLSAAIGQRPRVMSLLESYECLCIISIIFHDVRTVDTIMTLYDYHMITTRLRYNLHGLDERADVAISLNIRWKTKSPYGV